METYISISLGTILAGLKWYAVGVVVLVLLSNLADDVRSLFPRRKS